MERERHTHAQKEKERERERVGERERERFYCSRAADTHSPHTSAYVSIL
jgi:hypothetical protein